MPDPEREQNPSRRIATTAAAALLAGAGLAAGWLTVMGVLALPLPEGALFALAGFVALGALVGAYCFRDGGRALR